MNYEYENNVYIIAPTDVPLFRQKKYCAVTIYYAYENNIYNSS